MGVAITDEHVELARVADGFLETSGARSASRELLETEVEELPPFWKAMAELGWLGLHISEAFGGSGYSTAELAVVLEQLGRHRAPGPFLPTVMASAVIDAVGGGPVRERLLPRLTDGSSIGAVSVGGSLGLAGGRLSGDAGLVLGAGVADVLVLAAGGALVVVDREAPGVEITPRQNLDPTRRAASVVCRDVTVEDSNVIADGVGTARRIQTLLAATEAAGGASACVEMAVAYAKERVQFGRPVASFQAVKHHCTNMVVAAELASAAAWDGHRSTDPSECSLAGAVAGTLALPAYLECAKKNIQVHGGIAFTWEHDAHLHLRRATALAALFGPVDDHARAVHRLVEGGARRKFGLELPPEADQYRTEAREVVEKLAATDPQDQRRVLADSGYLAPHYPEPWGRGAGAVEQLVIDEELRGIDRPWLGLAGWILPSLMSYGTTEQQERWVRPTLYGEVVWCQLFSETEAGSDLASLRTRAEKVDGGWVLHGQKVWTSGAQFADRGLCLARTDPTVPKHEGIGCFVIDMHADGVDVRPLREITGEAMFNEVFLDGVFVPDEDLVGEPTQGWQVARNTLTNERISIGGDASVTPAQAKDVIDLIARRCPDNPCASAALGALLAEKHGLGLLGLRGGARAVLGAAPGPEGAVAKLVGAEHDQKATDLAMELLGPDAALVEAGSQPFAQGFLFSRCLTIAGGTSEVIRNVIAEQVLGMPREPNLK